MKKVQLLILLLLGISQAEAYAFKCPANVDCSKGNVLVTTKTPASIFVDGQYTGKQTPSMLTLKPGEHMIGAGFEQQRVYYRRQINLNEVNKKPLSVALTVKDKPNPTTWKALFVGVPSTTDKAANGLSEKAQCTTHFSKQNLDDAFEFFKFNLKSHIEPFSYNTVKWDIERQDLRQPAQLSYNPKNKWYTLEPEQGLAHLDNVKAGDYDTIFYFWREEQDDCSFKSGYFGLAWLTPTAQETRQTGYVTVKFNPGTIGTKATLENYKNKDPGVWTHEWLHVVIEQFYPNRKVKVPIAPKDKLILHSAVAYGYKYPWIQWYKDLISGQVPLGQTFTGIGPDALLDCTIRGAFAKKC